MIIRSVTLCPDGSAQLPGYASEMQLGYAGNCGCYAVQIDPQGLWQGLTVRALWHLPGTDTVPTCLMTDNQCAVPAIVTAEAGRGVITFEGTNGAGLTIVSADVHYRVGASSGTEDGVAPEPGTTAWEEFVRRCKLATDDEASAMLDDVFN